MTWEQSRCHGILLVTIRESHHDHFDFCEFVAKSIANLVETVTVVAKKRRPQGPPVFLGAQQAMAIAARARCRSSTSAFVLLQNCQPAQESPIDWYEELAS